MPDNFKPTEEAIQQEQRQLESANYFNQNLLIIDRSGILKSRTKIPKKIENVSSSRLNVFIHNEKCSTSIHSAIRSRNHDILEKLLDTEDRIDVNKTDSLGNTLLHIAAKYGNAKAIESILIYDPKVKINQVNQQGRTPLQEALKHKHKGCIWALKEIEGIDLSAQVSDGCTLKELLNTTIPESDLLFEAFTLLKFQQIKEFAQFIERYEVNPDDNNGRYTFLQFACHQGSVDAVKYLILKGAELTKVTTTEKDTPLMIAGSHGYIEIIRAFYDDFKNNPRPLGLMHYKDFSDYYIENDKIFRRSPLKEGRKTILHRILQGVDFSKEPTEDPDHLKCMEFILEEGAKENLPKPNINQKDELGDTALHIASRMTSEKSSKYVALLLNYGAYVGYENNKGEMAISKIDFTVLKMFMDSCVTKSQCKSVCDWFYIVYNYSFLAPPLVIVKINPVEANEKQVDVDVEENGVYFEEGENISETAPLIELYHTKELKPLLKHPVLMSFLNLKWHMLKMYCWVSLLTYSFSTYHFTWYILHDFESPYYRISKWSDIFSLEFFMRSTTYWWFFGWLVRILFMMIMSWRMYFRSLENYLDMAAFSSMAYVIFQSNQIVKSNIKDEVGAVTIILCWSLLVLFIFKDPFPSKVLETIKYEFLSFLKTFVTKSTKIGVMLLILYLLFQGNNTAPAPAPVSPSGHNETALAPLSGSNKTVPVSPSGHNETALAPLSGSNVTAPTATSLSGYTKTAPAVKWLSAYNKTVAVWRSGHKETLPDSLSASFMHTVKHLLSATGLLDLTKDPLGGAVLPPITGKLSGLLIFFFIILVLIILRLEPVVDDDSSTIKDNAQYDEMYRRAKWLKFIETLTDGNPFYYMFLIIEYTKRYTRCLKIDRYDDQLEEVVKILTFYRYVHLFPKRLPQNKMYVFPNKDNIVKFNYNIWDKNDTLKGDVSWVVKDDILKESRVIVDSRKDEKLLLIPGKPNC